MVASASQNNEQDERLTNLRITLVVYRTVVGVSCVGIAAVIGIIMWEPLHIKTGIHPGYAWLSMGALTWLAKLCYDYETNTEEAIDKHYKSMQPLSPSRPRPPQFTASSLPPALRRRLSSHFSADSDLFD